MADCGCYWLKGMRDKTVPAASSAAASREAAQRDWTEGKILNNLLSLSRPIMIGSVLTTLGPVVAAAYAIYFKIGRWKKRKL